MPRSNVKEKSHRPLIGPSVGSSRVLRSTMVLDGYSTDNRSTTSSWNTASGRESIGSESRDCSGRLSATGVGQRTHGGQRLRKDVAGTEPPPIRDRLFCELLSERSDSALLDQLGERRREDLGPDGDCR